MASPVPANLGSFDQWNPNSSVSPKPGRPPSSSVPYSSPYKTDHIHPGPSATAPYPLSTATPYYATPAPTNFSGYTANHLNYEVDKERRAKQAYAAHGGYTVTIEVRAVVLPVGKTTPKIIGDVLECIDHVPAHIGAVALKTCCFNAIAPAWSAYSNGYPISCDSLILRDDKWVAITPRDPDVDAIAHRFYKPPKRGSNTMQFRSKKIVMNLHFLNKIYDDFLRVQEAAVEQQDFDLLQRVQQSIQDDAYDHFSAVPSEGSTSVTVKSKGKGKAKAARPPAPSKRVTRQQTALTDDSAVMAPPEARMSTRLTPPATVSISSASSSMDPLFLQASSKLDSVATRPSTPPRSSLKRPLPDSPGSPQYSKEEMKQLVKRQTNASRLQLGSLFAMKMITAAVYPMKPLNTLLDLASTDSHWKTYCGNASSVSIMLTTDPKEQKVGAFKMASFGVATPPIFGNDPNVCAKQSYYESKGLRIAGTDAVPIQNVAHDVGRQAKVLTMELRCLTWARVLLLIIYDFIRRFTRDHGQPPFEIPQLAFVQAALAMIPGADQDLYLLEECIGANEGKFRKYINNRAAIPTVFNNVADDERAKFLCFTQHYQYLKTHKMVFVSDYQGGDRLLTDPQIMSAPSLDDAKHLFADGNVSAGFSSFEADHVCNKFCRFFELSTDFANWGSSSNADAGLNDSEDEGAKSMEISAMTHA
ncbi:hypothetical protein MVEN_00863000 [Mycena venus]|uniref:Alpha-type protein kinase domain-containing protein n=1 Tax=Mycena venus TaxID=2733690 RepID=A0A8H7D147_9AGAR|nr:hypothetical protein MVEN_00863000 [Mycena venus]